MKKLLEGVWTVAKWTVGVAVVLFIANQFVQLRPGASAIIGGTLKKMYPENSGIPSAKSIADLIALRNGYNAIWSTKDVWPEVQLLTERSPVLQYIGPENNPGENQVSKGSFQVLLVASDNKSVWHNVDLPVPAGMNVVYWKTDRPLRADMATVAHEDGLPGVVVPVSQRTTNGVAHTQYWAYREDIRSSQEELALAPWGRSIIRNDVEDDGYRQIIDRYTVVLERGQSSKELVYSMPPVTDDDLKYYKYRWQLRFEGVTLLAKVNGQPYTFAKGRSTDTSEVESASGVVLEVRAATDAKYQQTPVEFVFIREIREN